MIYDFGGGGKIFFFDFCFFLDSLSAEYDDKNLPCFVGWVPVHLKFGMHSLSLSLKPDFQKI